MKESLIRDASLSDSGRVRIEWAERRMPVCMGIRKRFEEERPLRGLRISACLHVTKESAVLAETLSRGGAEVALCASNPLSTQDDVAAALVEGGISVYALRGMDTRLYYECISYALAHDPDITIDDGADLTVLVHELHHGMESTGAGIARGILGEKRWRIRGGTEETTTGVKRLRSLWEQGLLLYPIIAVNDASTKRLFDNPVGTGQSALDGVIRSTNILIAGKRVVVAGYGHVGSGIASRARGLGAEVIVVEVDPVRALEAAMNGFRVTTMEEAARVGDIFITATGDISVIRRRHFELMRSGAILANAGHYDVEISKRDLEEMSVDVSRMTPLITKYTLRDGRELFLLTEGRLVNLVAAEGHPSDVMDLSFALQALSTELIGKGAEGLGVAIHSVPSSIDMAVARAKLSSMGITIDELTEEQRRYLADWRMGTL